MSSVQPTDFVDPNRLGDPPCDAPVNSGLESSPDLNAEIEQAVMSIRSDLKFMPRRYSGEASFLIEDTVANRFFNLGPKEYEFIAFFDGEKNLKQVFDEYVSFATGSFGRQKNRNAGSDSVLGWDQARKIVGFLRQENLVATVNGKELTPHSNGPQGRILNVNPIGLRIRLFNANPICSSIHEKAGFLFSKSACVVWLVLVIWAIGIAIRDFEKIRNDIGLLIQPENFFWMSVCWIMLKFLHESGHAIRCRMEGGRVGDAGVNFLLLLPMPFVDVTSSWRFASMWKRISVAAAGMYFELFVAAIFILIWSFDFGPTMNSLSIQVVLMASLSTLLFNANPLMKFDGYYILSDLLKRPNLAVNGIRYQRSCLKALLFGIKPDNGPMTNDWVTKIYGWLAAVWRVVIAIGLLIAASTFLHGAGIVLAGLAIFFWYIKPLADFVRSIGGPDAMQRISWQRVLLSLGFTAVLVIGLALLPWPFSPNAVGVVAFANEHSIRAGSDGFVIEIHTFDGYIVEEGDVLAKLKNDDLALELESLRIDREVAILESRGKRRKKALAEWQAVEKKITSLEEQIEILQRQIDELTISAPAAGRIVSQRLSDLPGSYLKKGAELMKVVPFESLEIVASIDECNAPLFHTAVKRFVRPGVVIHLESGQCLESELNNVEPTASRRIIHNAVGAGNGGPLPIRQKSNSKSRYDQTELATPNFKAKTVVLGLGEENRSLLVGQRCRVYLHGRNHSCLAMLQFSISHWFHENWSKAELANKG